MKLFKCCCVFFLILFAHIEAHTLRISSQQARRMGEKIWKNESGQSFNGLTAWNQGEEFASLGIGHFIWFPQGLNSPFKQTFPQLLAFMGKKGVVLPDWLKQAKGCPWNSREDFHKAFNSEKMVELRELLNRTVDLQIYFMVERLKNALPLLVVNLKPAEQRKVRFQFQRLCQSCAGLYALLDYLNFKGEGVLTKESYQGTGWGLRQVLLRMNGRGRGAVEEFTHCAKEVLHQRVQNAPSHRNEERWIPGWFNRLDTYPIFS